MTEDRACLLLKICAAALYLFSKIIKRLFHLKFQTVQVTKKNSMSHAQSILAFCEWRAESYWFYLILSYFQCISSFESQRGILLLFLYRWSLHVPSSCSGSTWATTCRPYHLLMFRSNICNDILFIFRKWIDVIILLRSPCLLEQTTAYRECFFFYCEPTINQPRARPLLSLTIFPSPGPRKTQRTLEYWPVFHSNM